MTALFWASYLLVWVLLAAVTLLVLLLYRQYGRSVLPTKERFQLAGLDIGVSVRQIPIGSGEGEPRQISLLSNGDGPMYRVLMFGSSACPICARLWEEVDVLPAEQQEVEYWWLQAGEMKPEVPPTGWRLLEDPGGLSHEPMQVPALPYAYVLNTDGVVLSKGLMNSTDDIRALIGVAARNAGDRQFLRVDA